MAPFLVTYAKKSFLLVIGAVEPEKSRQCR
ncbi:hypothetical protein SAMN05216361_3560 [Marisediminitalea aggregata]|uniref:Uncharacterized protein n=1 Tax=Marisediminitalea aggregata TaxID=634436 RepID=A0A1M5PQY5_9ALTE|nr:hypothetical protein SAMN05216361_3560 [Marisediminitalea aggregata]